MLAEEPVEIPEAPDIPEWAFLHWDCFMEALVSSPGGNISTGAVLTWCVFHDVRDPGLREDILSVVRLLQGEYVGGMKARRSRAQSAADQYESTRKGGKPPGAPPLSNVQKFKRGPG